MIREENRSPIIQNPNNCSPRESGRNTRYFAVPDLFFAVRPLTISLWGFGFGFVLSMRVRISLEDEQLLRDAGFSEVNLFYAGFALPWLGCVRLTRMPAAHGRSQ